MRSNILHIIQRVFLFVLAIQILNLSTNVIDFQRFPSTNLYEFNDLNTIVEYVAEIVLDYKNAFPESDQQPYSSKAQFEKHVNFKLFFPDALVLLQKIEDPVIRHNAWTIEAYNSSFYKEINPPPPKG